MARVREVRRLSPIKVFLYLIMVAFVTIILIGFTMLPDEFGSPHTEHGYPDFEDKHEGEMHALDEPISEPLILWWDGFTGEVGQYKKCGQHSCYFTIDRHYLQHRQTKVILFYGSNLNLREMPLPRRHGIEWGLLHEESPKNNYALLMPDFIELFNHTATFRRESDFPLTTQYIESIEWLESNQFRKSVADKTRFQSKLAPVVFIQSDCDVPSDRDSYVSMLMKHIKVDSYGECVHNKDLPEHLKDPVKAMDHDDLYHLVSKYKFSLAMENAVCDDYITEKIWRPFMLGVVPIIHGSPTIRDLLPDEHSAILIEDFKTVKDLADHIKYLNENDQEYNKYLEWKKTGVKNGYLKQIMAHRTWGIRDTWINDQTNFVDDFACFVCNRIHENIRLERSAQRPKVYQTSRDHFSCPEPMKFSTAGGKPYGQHLNWIGDYRRRQIEAKAFRFFADKNIEYSKGDFHAKVMELSRKHDGGVL